MDFEDKIKVISWLGQKDPYRPFSLIFEEQQELYTFALNFLAKQKNCNQFFFEVGGKPKSDIVGINGKETFAVEIENKPLNSEHIARFAEYNKLIGLYDELIIIFRYRSIAKLSSLETKKLLIEFIKSVKMRKLIFFKPNGENKIGSFEEVTQPIRFHP